MRRTAALSALLLLGVTACGAVGRTGGAADRDMAAVAARPGTERASPSGRFVLGLEEVKGQGVSWRVRVRSAAGAEVFRSDERFSIRHRTYVLWDDETDRVWAYSSDIGTYLYDIGSDGGWVSSTWSPSRPEAPPALKAAVPRRFA